MLYWIIQTAAVSIVFILVVHNIFHFLKDTLTVPKAKDLVDVHMEKYKHIYATLNADDLSEYPPETTVYETKNTVEGTTRIDDIPVMSQEAPHRPSHDQIAPINKTSDMKNELKNFMKKQLSAKQPASQADSSGPVYMQL
jgi:hypothetical protein